MAKLNGLDRELIKKLRHHNGLTKSDCTINVMRPVQSYGSGCKGFVDTYMCGLVREMEELLSNPGDPGCAVRNSIALSEELKGNEKGLYKRAVQYNVRVIGNFGIFIRDICKVMESIFLEQLIKKAQSKRLEAMGDAIIWHVRHYGFAGTGRCNSPYRHGTQGT